MSDNEEYEFGDMIIEDYDDDLLSKTMYRYNNPKEKIAFAGVGTFICSRCVIEACKNIIGMDALNKADEGLSDSKPDNDTFNILTLDPHDESVLSDVDADILAVKCIDRVGKKFKGTENDFLENGFVCMPTIVLQNIREPGMVMMAVKLDKMVRGESREEFAERVATWMNKIGVCSNQIEVENHLDEDDNEGISFGFICDIMEVMVKGEESDVPNDFNEGVDSGVLIGKMVVRDHIMGAMYKVFKRKKKKDFEKIAEEIEEVLDSIDKDELDQWVQKYKKKMEEFRKKQIGDDDEEK